MSTDNDNVLETETRSALGSRASRKARRAGRVPVNIFGHGRPNVSATVDGHDLARALATTTQVFSLDVGGVHESCLVKEVQYDTFGQQILHVDLARIDLTEEVHVVVALEFRGNAKGLAEGGVQLIHHPSLAVLCSAGKIPDSIVVDVSEVELGQTVHAGEIALPTGLELDVSQMADDEPVVGVVQPKKALSTTAEGEEGETEGEGAEGAESGDTPSGEEGTAPGDSGGKDGA